jgi:hypothetical protein
MINILKALLGFKIEPKSGVSQADSVGELEVLSSDSKLRYHNGVSSSPIVTESHSSELTNKTIDADNNTISNLEVDNLKVGVLDTDLTAVSLLDDTLPSAKAVKTYVDNKAAAQDQASEITYSSTTSGLTATNVQAAIDEVDANLDAHLADTIDAHDASAISNVPAGNLVATDIQGAVNELQSDIDTRALQTSLDTTNTNLSNHEAATVAHGATGAVVGTTNTQTLVNKTLDNTSIITVKDANLAIQDDVDTTKQVKLQASSITTATTRTLTIPDADGTIVLNNNTQTLTNKTLDNTSVVTVKDSNLTIQDDVDTTKQVKIQASGVSTLTTRTLSVPNADGTIVLDTNTQTLSGKTIVAASNTITTAASGNLVATELNAALAELQGDIDTRATSSELTTHTGASSGVHGVTGNVVGTTDAQTLTNKNLVDASTAVVDSVDATKQIKFDAAGTTATSTTLTSSQTINRVITLPDATDTLVGKATTDTLTNKTLSGASIESPTRADVKKDTLANLTTYASTATDGQLVFATDTQKMYQVVSSALAEVGGGGGQSLDTVFQLFADEEITDWTTGNNATFLGVGTLVGTFAKDEVTPLAGTASYKYTQALGSLNDYVASAVQDVDLRFRGQTCTLFFPYQYNGSNDDITPVIYDVTNATVLASGSEYALDATNSGTKIYRTNVVIPLTCTQVRVGFQVLVENSGKILAFDDVQLTSDTTVYADLTDIDSAIRVRTGNGFGSTNTSVRRFVTTDDSTGSDITYSDSSTLGGSFTVGTAGLYDISYSDQAAGETGIMITKNATTFAAGASSLTIGSFSSAPGINYDNISVQVYLNAGDVIRAIAQTPGSVNSTSALANFAISRVGKTSASIITAPESFSTDTASLTYASSSQYTLSTLANAPVGTFITYTYAATTNTRTQTTTAPTQTTSDMNTNGIQIFTRSRDVASTSDLPATVMIQIGKGLKGYTIDGYFGAAKATPVSLDFSVLNTSTIQGLQYSYNESTGVLDLDAGFNPITNTTRYFQDMSNDAPRTSAYLVINASKSPALVGVPQVQPRIATIKDVKASGTAGGSFTAGSYLTRTLNTLDDPTGFVTSLTSNQFTLPGGRYYIEAKAPAYFVTQHKAKIVKDPAGTPSDTLIGSSEYSEATGSGQVTYSFIEGEVIIDSASTFEIQHKCSTTNSTSGFGTPSSYGVDEVYTQVKILKVK